MTTLIVSATNSLKIVLQTVDNFGTISGLKLNLKKQSDVDWLLKTEKYKNTGI